MLQKYYNHFISPKFSAALYPLHFSCAAPFSHDGLVILDFFFHKPMQLWIISLNTFLSLKKFQTCPDWFLSSSFLVLISLCKHWDWCHAIFVICFYEYFPIDLNTVKERRSASIFICSSESKQCLAYSFYLENFQRFFQLPRVLCKQYHKKKWQSRCYWGKTKLGKKLWKTWKQNSKPNWHSDYKILSPGTKILAFYP